MVHVRECNMSAKIVALPSKSNICEIKEMKLLRSLPLNNTECLTSDINQSKLGCKDQESIQSSTIPDPGYQWESDKLSVRHHKRDPRGHPFPQQVTTKHI